MSDELRVLSTCDTCRDPGHCCRGFVLSREFPASADAEDALRSTREGTNPMTGEAGCYEVLPHFVPVEPVPHAETEERDAVRWRFRCEALGEDGRCTVYKDRPKLCRTYEPKSDGLCAEFEEDGEEDA